MHRLVFAVSILLGLASMPASAAYPDRPVRLIVPYPAGAGNDLIARMVGQKLSDLIGQPIVIENRPGASGNIGAEVAAHAPADGYTLLMLNNSHTINSALNPKLRFDVVRDFVALAKIGVSPMLLCSSNEFPAKNVSELVAYAKANPGKVNYGSSGYGTPQHLGAEMLAVMAGIEMTHVPYKGQAPSNQALLSNEIQFAFGTVAGFVQFVKAGRIRALAAAGTSPPKEFPDLATVAQSGYPEFNIDLWYVLAAPAATPEPVVKFLSEALAKVLANPTTRAELERMGFDINPVFGAELSAFIKADLAKWRDLVRKTNLPPPDSESK